MARSDHTPADADGADAGFQRRLRLHAALADAHRLAIVDELAVTDRSPRELGSMLGIPGNLLAHHLDVLVEVGLVTRRRSDGDGRRRYLHLDADPLRVLGGTGAGVRAPAAVLFVCSHNSARSQLAAALFRHRFDTPAESAGTEPAPRVHPGAVAAARRHGLDLGGATPRHLDEVDEFLSRHGDDVRVVTVCDRAHEELDPDPSWWHWSIADPVVEPSRAAFDAAIDEIGRRFDHLGTPAA